MRRRVPAVQYPETVTTQNIQDICSIAQFGKLISQAAAPELASVQTEVFSTFEEVSTFSGI